MLDFLFGFIFLQLFQMLITAGLISQQKQDKALQKPIRKKSSTKLHFFFYWKSFIEELADNNQFYILFIVSGCTLCRDQHLDKNIDDSRSCSNGSVFKISRKVEHNQWDGLKANTFIPHGWNTVKFRILNYENKSQPV